MAGGTGTVLWFTVSGMGAVDILVEGECWEWHVAAGLFIPKEASGLVTTAKPPQD